MFIECIFESKSFRKLLNLIQGRKSKVKREKVPIIFLIYNRPDITKQTLKMISTYQPECMYVVADGPKNSQDNELCNQTRALFDNLDWDCKVFKNFADTNLKCGVRVSSGISWAFETCDKAIILEDDCLPDSTFFRFCEELLEKYEDNPRIGIISGTQRQINLDIKESYYFSKLPNIGGWATWKRTWQTYDFNMSNWPKYRKILWLFKQTGSLAYARKRRKINDKVYNGQIDTWAYQFTFMSWQQNLINISPKSNLISNIGFDSRATHITDPSHKYSANPTIPIEFPLIHPNFIIQNIKNDFREAQHRLQNN